VNLVLSLFPGIGLLDRAFEEEGFTVVRGPDPLWGGDIRRFHVPAGRFDGIIGGPPCQHWTRLMFLNPNAGKGMGWVVDEFARIVEDAQPDWFLMEEVLFAPMPLVPGYHIYDVVLSDDEVGGVQPRTRRLSFGTHDGKMLFVQRHEKNGNGRAATVLACDSGMAYEESRRIAKEQGRRKQSVLADARAVPVKLLAGGKEKRTLPGSDRQPTVMGHAAPGQRRRTAEVLDERRGGRKATVLAGHGPVGRSGGQYESNLTIEEMCEYQGLPRDFTDKMPFTMHGKRSVIGNGVPLPMGRAIAQAVKRALAPVEMAVS